MSIQAFIGIQNKSGKSISYIHCHSDSYIEGVGKILLNDYKTRQKVFRLIAHGHVSVLGSRINPRKGTTHDKSHRQPDVCLFCNRDMGEPKSDRLKSMLPKNFRGVIGKNGISYGYYIDNNNVWWVSIGGNEFSRLDTFPEAEVHKKLNKKESTVKFSFSVKNVFVRQEILGVLNKFNVEYSMSAVK
jgi:hypothetical protein